MVASKKEVVQEFTKPVVKLLIVVFTLFLINAIVGFLPGMDALIVEDEGLTTAETATAALSLIGILYIVKFGRDVNPKIKNVLETEVVEDIAYFTEYLIYLIAIIVAYRTLTDVILALIPFQRSFYNFVFLLISLYPTGKIALNIYDNLDEYGELVTQKAVSKVEE